MTPLVYRVVFLHDQVNSALLVSVINNAVGQLKWTNLITEKEITFSLAFDSALLIWRHDLLRLDFKVAICNLFFIGLAWVILINHKARDTTMASYAGLRLFGRVFVEFYDDLFRTGAACWILFSLFDVLRWVTWKNSFFGFSECLVQVLHLSDSVLDLLSHFICYYSLIFRFWCLLLLWLILVKRLDFIDNGLIEWARVQL